MQEKLLKARRVSLGLNAQVLRRGSGVSDFGATGLGLILEGFPLHSLFGACGILGLWGLCFG